MKLGCCAEIEHAPTIKKAGFDFIECTVVSLMPDNDEDYEAILKKYQESPLPVEVCNVFLPGDLKVTGDNVNQEKVKDYLEKAIPRVKQIGADTIVFGSGAARTLPDGFSKEKGEEQIIEFLKMAADVADPINMTIVIEPLNQKESNIINSVPQAQAIAEKVNRPSIQVLADFYHMDEENEPLETIVAAKEMLKHVHVADTGRLAPGTGNYPYQEFKKNVEEADYQGRISIECTWEKFEEELLSSRTFLEGVFSR